MIADAPVAAAARWADDCGLDPDDPPDYPREPGHLVLARVLLAQGDGARALALLEREAAPDGAILDLNLGGEPAYSVADVLLTRGVPVVFTTGYDASTLPERFAHILRCEKPFDIRRIKAALVKVIHA